MDELETQVKVNYKSYNELITGKISVVSKINKIYMYMLSAMLHTFPILDQCGL